MVEEVPEVTQGEFSFESQRPMSVLEQRFREFHANNPRVYELFREFTLQAIGAGRKRYGAFAILNRIRWHVEIETRGDEFRINNNWSPFYARLFMLDHPQHDGFFETRLSKADAMGAR